MLNNRGHWWGMGESKAPLSARGQALLMSDTCRINPKSHGIIIFFMLWL